jgi:hypothetical protein
MKCKLVKMTDFSGNKASVYSVIWEDESETLFDKFVEENVISFKSEIFNIIARLNAIGHKTGARINFFKEFEGKPGDGVCALYDQPSSNLRLYCIRYGTPLIVLGGGGEKPKTMKAFQESEKLTKENYFLRWLSEQISERIADKTIRYVNNYQDFEGDLEFDYEENK